MSYIQHLNQFHKLNGNTKERPTENNFAVPFVGISLSLGRVMLGGAG